MGLKFRKSFKVVPGVRVNVGKTRSSVSLGGKGITTNVSKRGVKTTVSIPKTGLSYSTKTHSKKHKGLKEAEVSKPEGTQNSSFFELLVGTILWGVIIWAIIAWLL